MLWYSWCIVKNTESQYRYSIEIEDIDNRIEHVEQIRDELKEEVREDELENEDKEDENMLIYTTEDGQFVFTFLYMF